MNLDRLLTVVRVPHISEKSTIIADKLNHYTFKVMKDANKAEIKAAIEHVFKVKVKKVLVLNFQGKTKRFKKTEGKRSDWKKAYVSLESGHEIQFSEHD